ncbi:MAG TPA: PmoA family protein [Vicinamibacterales bacterium]|nr:PmoA family protein [Vicinamibacterales bacterium]
MRQPTLHVGVALALGAAVAFGRAPHGLKAQSARPARQIEIAAGSVARRGTIVSFPLEGVRDGAVYTLRDPSGRSAPLQIDAAGTAWSIVPELSAGESRLFQIVETPHDPEGMTADRQDHNVGFSAGGRPVLDYVGGAGRLPAGDIKPIFQRGGYLHPVRTPSGRIVTGDYPADHRHHHGIWFAWTKTAFQGREPDFWNMGDGKGRVEAASLDRVWSGRVHAGLRAQHQYIDLTSGAPIVVLRERWDTRVFAGGGGSRPYHVFDVEVLQTNVSASPLALPEYHYGGIGVRGAAEFVPLDNASFLTSEGKDRKTGDATASRWAYIAGEVNGARAGIAILGHPANFRAPQPMRIHPTDPYLCYAPSRQGAWEIAPAATHVARYRFVAFDGAIEPAELDRLWRDYAEPPVVTVR